MCKVSVYNFEIFLSRRNTWCSTTAAFFLLFQFFFSPTLFKKKNICRTYLEKSFQSTVPCEMLMKYQLWPALFFSIQDHSSNFPQKLMFDFSFLWQCLERKNPA